MKQRLLQVSDCHLSRQPHKTYRGQDPDANLERIASSIKAFGPDLLVLTGDLSEDASAQSYQRIVSWAGAFDCPVAWLPGNHDDRAAMQPLFDAAGFDAGPVILTGSGRAAWQLVLLDSTWPDDPSGELDDARLRPLAQLEPGLPTGVFVHHQPINVGAAWIDKVGMRHRQRLVDAVRARPEVRFVAFGHVHQRFRAHYRQVEWLACPSTAANSKAATPRFAAGETTPMARWFVLSGQHFNAGYLAPAR
ncbi:MAG: metallophosphoesterase [Wenzhouxiangellaceae bacterium]